MLMMWWESLHTPHFTPAPHCPLHFTLVLDPPPTCPTMPWWLNDPSHHGLSFVSASPHHPHQPPPKLPSLAAIVKTLLITRRCLRLHPDQRLFFLYEPGKQVSSAVKIKNTSRSPVAFKFQTNAPKSCFMRPPSGILAPGEIIIATVVKFVEVPEQNEEKKSKDKFKIVSLKVKQGSEFNANLFEERKDFVAVEQVLRVVFLDPEGQSPEIEKLKKRLAEAEAAHQARRKLPEEKVQKTVAAGGVLYEWA